MSASVPAASSSKWLRPFARVTSGGRFVPEIDGLRAVAIGLVLLFHLAVDLAAKSPAWAIPAQGLLATPARFGFRGVELFFVISGFILGMPFAAHHLLGKSKVGLGNYFLRRVTRLEPPYILALAGTYLALVLLRDRSVPTLLPHFLAGLVYQHSLIFGTENPISNVAWSLEIEIQFYLLVPILSGLFAIRGTVRRRAVLLALIVVSAVCASLFLRPEMRAFMTILRFLHFFLGGFLLADFFLLDWSEHPKHRLRWDLLALAGIPLQLFLFARFGPPNEQGEPLVPLLSLTLFAPIFCAAVFRGKLLNRLLTNPWITAFGGMCYSIYLLHNPILGGILTETQTLRATGRWTIDLLIQGAIAIPLMMIPIAIFFLLIEKPCMQRDWPQRLVARLRG